jgi:NAD(P)-dependent dehydrogenase (short-subunit alcohol dehydrogenase family)
MAVVLVTGCSSGFGEAIAGGFLRRGDAVVATMRRPEEAPASLKIAAQHAGARLEIVRLDVTDAASRAHAIERTLSLFGRLDVLVNNAGVACSGSLEDTPLELLRLIFETNFFAPHELMRLALPIMRKQQAGRIVNITAIGAIFSTPLYNAYCSSKHAMDSISATADIDARPFGVRVISVLPGQFKTGIGEKRLKSAVSDAYLKLSTDMAVAREKRAGDVLTDLSLVVEAVIEAATHPDPKPRYAVGKGMAEMLQPVIAELEKLHEFDLGRAGLRR